MHSTDDRRVQCAMHPTSVRVVQEARPLMEESTAKTCARLHPVLAEGKVAVVTGFVAATVDGTTTTLGRLPHHQPYMHGAYGAVPVSHGVPLVQCLSHTVCLLQTPCTRSCTHS